jgi:hypothetical protein
MRKVIAASAAISIAVLMTASSASAFEGGGRKPSEAPLITVGQHYTGQLNNHENDANYNGDRDVALYRLPPVTSRDQVTVNWHELPYTHSNGSFPICLTLAQGVDDFSWGSVFGNALEHECSESGPVYGVSGSGSAQSAITVQNTDASATYLEFFSNADEEESSDLETFPYDFSVEPPRHYLGLAFQPKSKVHANGVVTASVTTATGGPAPDGLPFSLSVTWDNTNVANYTAASLGGQVSFVLALPESAFHQRAIFVVSHGADEYQPISARAPIQVMPSVQSAQEVACAKATQRAHVLARQRHRLQTQSRRARGPLRRRLRHRARHVAAELHTELSTAASACADA